MSGRKNILVILGFVLSTGLITAAVSAMLVSRHDSRLLNYNQRVLFTAIGFLAGVFLFFLTFLYRNKMEAMRIQALVDYLEQVNTGKAVILSTSGEDDFSKLEDEIYKTVTFLYQTKEAAVQAKNDFAENLSNIAHQIKTPITAISLSIQMLKQDFTVHTKEEEKIYGKHLEQMEKQL